MSNTKKIDHPFNKVVELLPQIPEVDGVSAGVSPITFRWLTKGNIYVNIGLTEIKKYANPEAEQKGEKPTEEYCEIGPNVNSYGVKDEAFDEIHTGITEFITKWDEDQKKKEEEAKAKEKADIATVQKKGAENAKRKAEVASEG